MKQDVLPMVREIMTDFSDSTGVTPSENPQRRYLWTDAFAVCNFLGLYALTEDEQFRDFALRLVEQVHVILGRHRADDPRKGWISGLDEEDGRAHPTAGGLRIGKEMNERRPSDPFNERLEWDRDGQYYHYLTKWMHALKRVSRVVKEPLYNEWAIELARAAHARFVYEPHRGQKRMYWKMSIDLTRPLVDSMGHHDPLDGLITYCQLRAAGAGYSGDLGKTVLAAEIADMMKICEGKNWATDDPLGLGELFCNAYKTAQLILNGDFQKPDLVEILLHSSLDGLNSFVRTGSLALPADYRLAFRELGLSIGLHAAERTERLIREHPDLFAVNERLHGALEALRKFAPLSEEIEKFWTDKTHREASTWKTHREINMVMLATSLAPDGYLKA